MTRRRPRRKAFAAIVALAALAGCSIVPLSTRNAMHAFDLGTVDPGAVRFAVRVSDRLVLDPAEPVFRVSVSTGGAVPVRRDYALVQEPIGSPGVAALAKPGFAVLAYRLDERSVADLAEVLARSQSAPAGDRRLGVEAGFRGCLAGGGPSGPLPVATFVRLDAAGPYLVMTRERDLFALAEMAGMEVEVAPCRG